MAKPLFREQIRDYAAQVAGKDFDAISEGERSKLMARFFADRVLRTLNPSLVPTTDEEMNAAAIDGSDDCGVDFMAHEGDAVTIIQAKYSGHKKTGQRPAESNDHFESFSSVLSRLYRGPKQVKMNRKLKEAVADIDWENDTFQLYYITLRQVGENAFKREEQGVTPLTEIPDLVDRSSLELLDEERLNLRLRDVLNLAADTSDPVLIRFSSAENSVPWLAFREPESGRESYVGRVNGSQIAEVFKGHQSSLFALNIRNYIGDNGTNKEIRRTALKNPARFFYYNNGVSALAKKIEVDPQDALKRTLRCENFSIVNGAQTVRSIYKAWLDDHDSVREVELLFRVSEFGKVTQEEQEFLDNVTKFNNTQNTIKISDFRSNDRIQIDLNKKFLALPARKGKKFQYKNKRSGERDSQKIAIGMEDFVKTIFAFNHGPDDVYGGTQYLFDTSKAGGYMKLFGADGVVLPVLSQDDFNTYAGVWFLCEYVKEVWSKEPESEALERRWMVFFAVGESLRVIYGHVERPVTAALHRLCDPKWYTEPETHHFKTVARAHCKLAFKAMKDSYAREQASKGEDFRHRNWFRSDETLRAITAQLEELYEVVSDSTEKYVF